MKDPVLLRKFVQKKLRKGYPQGELINDLLKEGYSEEDIQKAIYTGSSLKNMSPEGSSNSSNIPLWYLLSVGFAILGLALVSVKFIWLSEYGWFFLTTGLVGIAARFLLPLLKEQIRK